MPNNERSFSSSVEPETSSHLSMQRPGNEGQSITSPCQPAVLIFGLFSSGNNKLVRLSVAVWLTAWHTKPSAVQLRLYNTPLFDILPLTIAIGQNGTREIVLVGLVFPQLSPKMQMPLGLLVPDEKLKRCLVNRWIGVLISIWFYALKQLPYFIRW